MRRLAAQCEALIRAVLPEARGLPVYVLIRSDAATCAPAGVWISCLDLAFREEIGPRWRGRGLCILVNPAAIADALRDQDKKMRCRSIRSCIFGVVLHELAHAIVGDGITPKPTSKAYAQFVRLVIDETFPKAEAPRPTPWYGHELPWIRTALHLSHRARLSGYHVSCRDVIDAASYRLSSTWKHLAALGDEPRRMTTWTFDRILRTSLPDAFRELWIGDTTSTKDRTMKLLERLRDRRRSVAKRYRAFIRDVADGETVSVDDAAAIMEAAGKTERDLKTDVERLEHRRELASRLAAIRASEAELKPLEAKIAKADAALADVQRKHDEAIWPAQYRIAKIKKGLLGAHLIEEELIDTADDDQLEELRQAMARVAALSNERSETKRATGLVETAKHHEKAAEAEPYWESERNRRRAKAEQCRRDGETAKKRLAEIDEKEMPKAEAEERAIRSKLEEA